MLDYFPKIMNHNLFSPKRCFDNTLFDEDVKIFGSDKEQNLKSIAVINIIKNYLGLLELPIDKVTLLLRKGLWSKMFRIRFCV